MQLRGRNRAGQRGSALLWALGIGLLVGAAASVIPGLLKRSLSTAFDEELQFEAQMLATNIKEITKYLILYEKVFYTGGTGGVLGLGSSPDPLLIDGDMRALWGQGFTAVTAGNMGLLTACGGYGMKAKYLGTGKLNNKPVFCPMYIRSTLFSGLMVEKMLFDQWAGGSIAAFTPSGEGHYELALNFTKSLGADSGKLLSLDNQQKLIRERDQRDLQVVSTVTFSTESAGFRAVASERYINIKSQVSFLGGEGKGRKFVEDNETIMMSLSTPKDFAVFIPYPTGGKNLGDNFPISDQVQVFGRTYFNGDLNLGSGDMKALLQALPVFNDTLVLSGTILPHAPSPNPEYLAILKQKFPKGIVTNYSASRYLLDGTCAKPVDALTNVHNMHQLYCDMAAMPGPATANCPPEATLIDAYIDRQLSGHCRRGTITVGSTVNYTDPTSNPGCDSFSSNVASCRTGDPVDTDTGEWIPATKNGGGATLTKALTVVSGGFHNVVVNNRYAAIVSPVSSVTVNFAGADIYGLVFGGRISVPSGRAQFHSLSALSVGLNGITDDSVIANLNGEAAEAYPGTSFPLLNMPVIYSSKEGFR